MSSVIVNDKGELYAGFSPETSKPIWLRSKREDCVLEDAIADTVVSQLKQLGFVNVVRRDAANVSRKWVPSELDASK